MQVFDSADYGPHFGEVLGPQILEFCSRMKKGETKFIEGMDERDRELMYLEFY